MAMKITLYVVMVEPVDQDYQKQIRVCYEGSQPWLNA